MMFLGLDIGEKHTGAAVADYASGVVFSLKTINHNSSAELLDVVFNIVKERQISEVVLGLPLLPGGTRGKQADCVYKLAKAINSAGITCSFVDERYTSERSMPVDKDASAACHILDMKLSSL